MSGAQRPQPLRVPVTDVTVRSSIVGGARRSREVINPALVVVQRPVRYISDPAPPPPAPSVAPEPAEPPGPVARAQHQPDGDDRYARVEVEPLDPLELEDEELEGDSLDDDEDDEEGELLDVSVPPPAPPEALRRPSSHPAAASPASAAHPSKFEPLLERGARF